MKQKTIEQETRKHLDNLGYSQFQLECKEKQTPHGLEALIKNENYAIEINYDPDWKNLFERAKQLHIKNKIKPRGIKTFFSKKQNVVLDEKAYGDAYNVLEAVIKHEHGHWRYCPFDMEYFEEILNAVSKGLRDAGLNVEKDSNEVFSKSNEFEDIIVNCALAIDEPSTVQGRSLKYLREAFVENEKNPRLPESYAVFVDVQMRLINSKATIAKDYCKDYDKKVKPVVDSVLMAFGKELQLGTKAVENSLTEEEKQNFIENLKNPNNWKTLAYEYAKLTAHLKSESREQETPFLSKFKEDPEFRTQVLQLALQKGHESGYADSFEIFQAQHKMSGKKIRHDIFGSKGYNVEQESLPFAYLSTEKTDNLIKASLGKTRAKVGGLQFKKKILPLTLPPRFREGHGSLADLLLVCDNSGSMQGDEYNLLIDTVYAIFQGLKEEKKSHLLNYGLLQFSSFNCQSWTGWHSRTEPLERKFYKTISSGKFGNCTQMPIPLLKSADKKGCALIGISDGAISNSSETIDALLNHIGPLVWLQIGRNSSVYQAVKNYGLTNKDKLVVAHLINNISELPNSLLQVTHQMYGRR
ncbi:MAG: VWA domain-containing protein [Nanoarchaeota archaeon]|nr:VWA domain-containing protein [Nanoarchaeota archaeon]